MANRESEPGALFEPSTHSSQSPAGRVLIIEDNDSVSRGMSDGLTDAGYEVVTAMDGASGVKLAEEFSPDVVIIDIGLPDRDGYEVARELRSSHVAADAVLVAASGYGLRAFRQVSDHYVFDHYLLKPVGVATLSALIEHSMKTRAGGSQQ